MEILPEYLQNPALFLVFIIWSIVWKGIALWRSARAGQRNWFILLLVMNTLGFLEIIYIFLVNKKEKQIS